MRCKLLPTTHNRPSIHLSTIVRPHSSQIIYVYITAPMKFVIDAGCFFMYHELTFFTGINVHDCFNKKVFVYNWLTFVTDCYCQYCRYILLLYMYAYISLIIVGYADGVVAVVVVIILSVSYDLVAVVVALVFAVEKFVLICCCCCFYVVAVRV